MEATSVGAEAVVFGRHLVRAGKGRTRNIGSHGQYWDVVEG